MSASALIDEIRSLVVKIAMKSHVSAANPGNSSPSTDDDIGGRRPPGGINHREDREAALEGYWLKSADHFQTRLNRILRNGRSEHELTVLRNAARETLTAWERTPLPSGQEPEYGSPQWKRWVAESGEDSGELARRFNVSRRYINRVRKDYG